MITVRRKSAEGGFSSDPQSGKNLKKFVHDCTACLPKITAEKDGGRTKTGYLVEFQ